MGQLERLQIWEDPAIRHALAWYLAVAENRRPAKFRIAATVPINFDPAAASEDALWAELDRLTQTFLARWEAIRAGAPLPEPADRPSLLELCRELAYRMLAHCNFCPWDCRVDRRTGVKLGACKLASGARVSTHFHHTGEELFYRGTAGSGTIFFTSCNMRCAFCQNGDISTDKDNGEEVDARTLAAMAWTLRREGCHNINWVGGEVVIHLRAKDQGGPLLFLPGRARRRRIRRGLQRADPVEQQFFHDPGIDEDPAHPRRRVVARPEIRARAMRHDAGEDALVLGDGDPQHRSAGGMGRGFHHPASGDAQPRRMLHLSGARLDRPPGAGGPGKCDGTVPSRQFLRSRQR